MTDNPGTAASVMVVTGSAGVIGNGGIPVAFIGQVRVKVTGKAAAGD